MLGMMLFREHFSSNMCLYNYFGMCLSLLFSVSLSQDVCQFLCGGGPAELRGGVAADPGERGDSG